MARVFPALLLSLVLVTGHVRALPPDEAPPLPTLFPETTLAFLHARGAETVVGWLKTSGLQETVTRSSLWQAFLDSPDSHEMRAGLAFLEGSTGSKPLPLLRDLLAGEVAVGVVPASSGPPKLLVVARPENGRLIRNQGCP